MSVMTMLPLRVGEVEKVLVHKAVANYLLVDKLDMTMCRRLLSGQT